MKRAALTALLLPLLVLSFRVSGQEEFVGPFPSWKNAKTQCGATGNGTTDDTSAVQSCINGLNGSYDVVYLPSGTYKITSTLSISQKRYVALIGQDPSNTTIKWAGPSGGTMLNLNGLYGSRWGRITYDGNSTAGSGYYYNFTGGAITSSKHEHFDEVFKNMNKGLEIGNQSGPGNDDTFHIIRCAFTGMTTAGISTESQNALEIWIWDSTFTNNARGLCNHCGPTIWGGNFQVYRCLFQNSSVSDVDIFNPAHNSSWRWNTSSGSNQFYSSVAIGSNGGGITFQGNKILDTTNSKAIEIKSVGPAVLLDNQIRSKSGAAAPAVAMNGNGTGGDLISIGNQYTVSPGYQVMISPDKSWNQGDSIVSTSAISSTLPTMPGTPPNNNEQIFDLSAGANASTIQSAINNATAVHNKAVVHLPKGNYNIASTITIPGNSDVQIVGDTPNTNLNWTGSGSGPMFLCADPCKAQFKYMRMDGNSKAADLVEVDTADAAGSRVWMEFLFSNHSGVDNVFADSLVNTYVGGAALAIDNEIGPGLKVTSNGNINTAVMALYGIAEAYNGNGNDPMYSVSNGGQLLVTDGWWEGSANLVTLGATKGNLIINGQHTSPQAGTPQAVIDESGFQGNITFFVTDLDLSHESNNNGRVQSGAETSSTNILYAGFQCCIFNVPVSNGPPYQWLYRTGSGGHVTGTNDKNTGRDGFRQTANFGDARNATNINNSLALLRSTFPPAAPISATPTGITDARLYGLILDNPRIGLHIKAVAAPCTCCSMKTRQKRWIGIARSANPAFSMLRKPQSASAAP